MEKETRRWKRLREFESWIETPMLALTVAWLGIVTYELAGGSNALLELIVTAIWVVFIAEFVLRLALAPAKGVFYGETGSRCWRCSSQRFAFSGHSRLCVLHACCGGRAWCA